MVTPDARSGSSSPTPGGNPVTVDATLHGPDGAVSSPNGKGILVPAHGRASFLLDSISGDLASPVVHVVAEGGVVGAVVNDTWLDGTRAGGSDDALPAAAPSRDQVIPAVLRDRRRHRSAPHRGARQLRGRRPGPGAHR